MPPLAIGAMRERLVLQRNSAPASLTISSLTRSGTTATATMNTAHGYATGDYVTIAGAVQAAYNGKFKITVTGTTTFTYMVTGSLATPATGSITVIYNSDAQGGRRTIWSTLETVSAELLPVGAAERLQLQAIQARADYRFRVWIRTDFSTKLRALWTPRWPPNQAQKTLEIHGIVPFEDGRRFIVLETGEVAA